jgi:hypothetical protein
MRVKITSTEEDGTIWEELPSDSADALFVRDVSRSYKSAPGVTGARVFSTGRTYRWDFLTDKVYVQKI